MASTEVAATHSCRPSPPPASCPSLQMCACLPCLLGRGRAWRPGSGMMEAGAEKVSPWGVPAKPRRSPELWVSDSGLGPDGTCSHTGGPDPLPVRGLPAPADPALQPLSRLPGLLGQPRSIGRSRARTLVGAAAGPCPPSSPVLLSTAGKRGCCTCSRGPVLAASPECPAGERKALGGNGLVCLLRPCWVFTEGETEAQRAQRLPFLGRT